MLTTASADLILADLDGTRRLGRRLAGLLAPGDVIGLGGGLGAGKTTLARHIIAALAGETMEVPSPTFTLVQAYEFAAFTLWHFDLYRIEQPTDVIELGFDEALDDGVALIEWPERMASLIPAERLDVVLTQGAEPDSRLVHIEAHGSWAARLSRIADD
jgi:tRNA threonylcarbamoyl adenosine modification protein YjeE